MYTNVLGTLIYGYTYTNNIVCVYKLYTPYSYYFIHQ